MIETNFIDSSNEKKKFFFLLIKIIKKFNYKNDYIFFLLFYDL